MTVIKKKLCDYNIGARVDLVFEVLDVRFHIGRFGVFFRVSPYGDSEVSAIEPVFLELTNVPHELVPVFITVRGRYEFLSTRRDVTAYGDYVLDAGFINLYQETVELLPRRPYAREVTRCFHAE